MKNILKISKSGLKLGDKDFYLASGDIHYFRIHPNDWKHRLNLAKDFGLTAIQVYVPWHLHEPKEGEFDFYGRVGELNLRGFLDLVKDSGLKIMFRPAPYICSECDLGGLPSWLLKRRGIVFRSRDEKYINPVKSYYKRLCKEFVPYLSTNGGPIIAVALDNEYGGFGNDKEYLITLRKILTDNGVDVPFYTTDGLSGLMTVNGSLEDCWHGINYRSTQDMTEKALEVLETNRPGFPLFVGEFWAGQPVIWGENFKPRAAKETADAYRIALNKGAYVNFYMFAGGTNFGFTSGSTYGLPFLPSEDKSYPRFLPYATSYDVDALIGEDGNPTEKYYLCRDVLDEYLGKPKRPHNLPKRKSQSITVKLTQAANLFDNLDILSKKTVKSILPMTMEELDQSFGYVLYTTELRGNNSWSRLALDDSVRDRATVYMNGKYKCTFDRTADNKAVDFSVPSEGLKIGFLVENMGRSCTMEGWAEYKGLVRPSITENCRNSFNWVQSSLPLDNISGLRYQSLSSLKACDNMPVFLKGVFDAKADVDTFVSLNGFTHGCIWVNGFNIGRYCDNGPQKTLYIPGSLLKENNNVIEIFDTEYNGSTSFVECQESHVFKE